MVRVAGRARGSIALAYLLLGCTVVENENTVSSIQGDDFNDNESTPTFTLHDEAITYEDEDAEDTGMRLFDLDETVTSPQRMDFNSLADVVQSQELILEFEQALTEIEQLKQEKTSLSRSTRSLKEQNESARRRNAHLREKVCSFRLR
jgi:hypothetical protein